MKGFIGVVEQNTPPNNIDNVKYFLTKNPNLKKMRGGWGGRGGGQE